MGEWKYRSEWGKAGLKVKKGRKGLWNKKDEQECRGGGGEHGWKEKKEW